MDFEEALPRLASAYDRGVLVPFLGAGMSIPACPDWKRFIAGLEREAGIEPAAGGEEAADLVRRANRAVRVLKRRMRDRFPDAVRAALFAPGDEPTEQTKALAEIWWPLVLTTNYDPLFFEAFRETFTRPADRMTVLGRSAQDCQQVLNSLGHSGGSILWALQGYLGRGRMEPHAHHLTDELVVGHEEYRLVAYTAQHFRRAFAEVFRRRSFLFLGSSLADDYLLNLFGEVLEISGANPLPHYALVMKGQVDVAFLRSRFNILAFEYGGHGELPAMLRRLRGVIEGRRARPVRWSFSLSADQAPRPRPRWIDLEIVRGVPVYPRRGEVVALSCATTANDVAYVSDEVRPFLARVHPPEDHGGFYCAQVAPHVVGFRRPDGSGPEHVVGVVARIHQHGRRDLRLVREAAAGLFDWAAERGYRRVRMNLLSSGKSAHFPAYYSLAAMLRAFGQWRRKTRAPLQLSIHTAHPGALFEVASGRMDVGELLTAEDTRFWVEVVDGLRVLEREQMFEDDETTVAEIAARFDVQAPEWTFDVRPRPTPDAQPEPVDARTLLEAGIIPGATLRLIAPETGERDRAAPPQARSRRGAPDPPQP